MEAIEEIQQGLPFPILKLEPLWELH